MPKTSEFYFNICAPHPSDEAEPFQAASVCSLLFLVIPQRREVNRPQRPTTGRSIHLSWLHPSLACLHPPAARGQRWMRPTASPSRSCTQHCSSMLVSVMEDPPPLGGVFHLTVNGGFHRSTFVSASLLQSNPGTFLRRACSRKEPTRS